MMFPPIRQKMVMHRASHESHIACSCNVAWLLPACSQETTQPSSRIYRKPSWFAMAKNPSVSKGVETSQGTAPLSASPWLENVVRIALRTRTGLTWVIRAPIFFPKAWRDCLSSQQDDPALLGVSKYHQALAETHSARLDLHHNSSGMLPSSRTERLPKAPEREIAFFPGHLRICHQS